MDLEYSEEQKILRDSVANFLKAELDSEKLRDLIETPHGMTDKLWTKMAEQGWFGVIAPEQYGGFGLGATELGIICEEMGRALMPSVYFSTAVLGVPAIAIGGTDSARERLLEKIIGGELKATLGLLDKNAGLGPSNVTETKAEKKGDGWVLNGTKYLVPDAMSADVIVVAAKTGVGDDGTTLFIVEKGAAGVSADANNLTDLTSRSGQIVLDNVEVGADAVVGAPGEGWKVVDQVLMIASVCLAGESVAASEKILKTTIDYAKERTQFGKPIGSFQAVKHPLANLFTMVESARSAYQYAAWAVDASDEHLRSAVACARLTSEETYRRTTLDSLQAHGGIGFTWEYDLHLYLKRAKHNQYFLGLESDYEQIIAAEALGI